MHRNPLNHITNLCTLQIETVISTFKNDNLVGKNAFCDNLFDKSEGERDDALFMQQAVLDLDPSTQTWSFGVVGVCSDFVDMAWSNHEQRFKSQQNETVPPSQQYLHLGKPERLRKTFLKDHPVECLVVEGEEIERVVEWITCVDKDVQPKIAVLMMNEGILESEVSPIQKTSRTKLEAEGYEVLYWHLNAFEHGAALNQSRVAIIMFKGKDKPMKPAKHMGPLRSMQNVLRCYSIPKKAYLKGSLIENEETTWPCISRKRLNGKLLYDPSGVMPDKVDCLLDTAKGVRMLELDELAKVKGLDLLKLGQPSRKQVRKLVEECTCQHLWYNVLDSIGEWFRRDSGPSTTNPPNNLEDKSNENDSEDLPFHWEPPDLKRNSLWYKERLKNLKAATEGLPDQDQLIRDGLKAMDFHRKNYTPDGPKHLQLLWWEFPPEHWESLRLGSSMNFLIEPTGELVPNSFMEDEDKEVAGKFVDELKSLGVLKKAKGELLANCPLFCVDKLLGKRVIADMKGGGQNECIGKDPVYLVQKLTILPQLYSGGYSAIADASKQFHNFPTVPEERKYLGCIHPITGERLVWAGLPMGSSNSPAIACRLTNSVLRQIREREEIFRGKPVLNTWDTKLTSNDYKPHRGHGRTLIRENGEPVALIWVMVDDFLIHGPNKKACNEAFRIFLDHMVRVGFICQVTKTKPPSQCQKFCGLIFNTTGHPFITIPPEKLSRSLATIDYIVKLDSQGRLSRLALSIMGGLLQLLVEATPARQGQTHLRSLYNDLHHTSSLYGKALYYSMVNLSEETLQDLEWWRLSLTRNVKNYSRTAHMQNLCINWGDGSGTGTGGTSEFADTKGTEVEAFMGVWKAHVHNFDSNWRELRTLLYALEFVISKHPEKLENVTLFYFTDNLVTYYVVHNGCSTSGRLHELIRRIKRLEVAYHFRLEPVHVPGTLMIQQGADGLSRGIGLSSDRMQRSTILESSAALQPVPFSLGLMEWILDLLNWDRSTRWFHHSDSSSWDASTILHTLSVWTPSPECARQAIDFFLTTWVESPLDSAGIFIIPRVLQKDWHYMSRHIQEFGVFDPVSLPDKCLQHSLIPFCILICYPHIRRISPETGLDRDTSSPINEKWFQHQAEFVRGLQ